MPVRLTPSDFYTYYRPSPCELRLYLSHKGIQTPPPGAFEQLIFKLGQRHEKNYLATFPDVTDLTGKDAERTSEEIQKGSSVIYQGRFQSEISIEGNVIEVIGIPDFMIKEGDGYCIRDCKMARRVSEKDHPEISRQLQIYGWLFEKVTGKRPLRLEVLKVTERLSRLTMKGKLLRFHIYEICWKSYLYPNIA